MYSLQQELTKEFILSHVSEEEIFERYLGVPVVFGKKICSPLRKDNHPTCGFAYSNQALYFRDFSGHFFGTCFDVVMYKYNCTFTEALQQIANDYGLDGGKAQVLTPRDSQSHMMMKIMTKVRADFRFNPRLYNEWDARYWTKFGITRKTLDYFEVVPVSTLYQDNLEVYSYSLYDPCYAYVYKPTHFKFYFPLRKTGDKPRFLSNTNVIQGIDRLPHKSNLLVITKSMKDIMVLYEASIPAIAWQGEGTIPDGSTIEELRERFKIIYSLYDFDLTGVRTANVLRKKHLIYPFFLTNGRFGSTDYKSKDPAEFVQNYGKEKFHETIKILKDTIEWEKLLSLYPSI